ncbi:MAG: Lrp/AsnC family transcriptional regulator [Clostridia bacterium]|nr:Lrp/AsnC family transcriptional regulator [Clostridia bacterium]
MNSKNLLLQHLENNSRLTYEQLSLMLDKEEGDIKKAVEEYEKERVIVGYKTLIDWDKTDREYVTALIELKVTPQRDTGFDSIAKKICNYPEVQSCYLMSGSFDISVLLEGKTMKEVALFVAEKLAPIEQVQSTATHFVLKKYKDNGELYDFVPKDERRNLN